MSESEAPVARLCDRSCVCTQGSLVDNIEQRVQEAQDYVEKAKDFIPKCKKFKKTGKRVRGDTNSRSAELTLSCFSPPLFFFLFFSSSRLPPFPPFLPSSGFPLFLSLLVSRVLHASSATNLFPGGNDRPHRVQCGALGRLCGEGGVRH